MKSKSLFPVDRVLVRKLQNDQAFTKKFLESLQKPQQQKMLLIALRHLAEARGGISEVADAAGMKRQSIHLALSPRGNPRLSTLIAIMKAMKLNLTLSPE
jgi:probable addiction module antidote protein